MEIGHVLSILFIYRHRPCIIHVVYIFTAISRVLTTVRNYFPVMVI